MTVDTESNSEAKGGVKDYVMQQGTWTEPGSTTNVIENLWFL